jgi:hypothetical protein
LLIILCALDLDSMFLLMNCDDNLSRTRETGNVLVDLRNGTLSEVRDISGSWRDKISKEHQLTGMDLDESHRPECGPAGSSDFWTSSHELQAMGRIIIVLLPIHRINMLAVNAHFEEQSGAFHNVRVF